MSERITLHERTMKALTTSGDTSDVLGPSRLARVRELALYVVFSPGTTQGVVVHEAAHREDFDGTWATLATITHAAANSVQVTNITGVHMAIRSRITTTIAGGTGDVIAVGN